MSVSPASPFRLSASFTPPLPSYMHYRAPPLLGAAAAAAPGLEAVAASSPVRRLFDAPTGLGAASPLPLPPGGMRGAHHRRSFSRPGSSSNLAGLVEEQDEHLDDDHVAGEDEYGVEVTERSLRREGHVHAARTGRPVPTTDDSEEVFLSVDDHARDDDDERVGGGVDGRDSRDRDAAAWSNVARDAFGVRRFTRLTLAPPTTPAQALALAAAALLAQAVAFVVEPNKIVVNWSPPVAGSSRGVPVGGHGAARAADRSAALICHITAAANGNLGTLLDFQKIRGDTITFHEFFMRMSNALAARPASS